MASSVAMETDLYPRCCGNQRGIHVSEIYQAIQFRNLNFKSLPLVQMVYDILTVNIFVTTFLCYKILIFTNHVC